MRRGLAYAGLALLVFLLGGIALLINGTGIGWLKAPLERQLSAALGRELRLAESPYLQLGDDLIVRARGARLANAAWTGDTPLLTLRDLEVRIATSSLLSGPVIVRQLRVEGVELALQRTADGESNLPQPGGTEEPAPEEPTAVPSEPPLLLLNADVRDVHITRHAPGEEALDFRIESLRQQSDGERTALESRGLLQEKPWTFETDASPLRNLLSGQPLTATFAGQLADVTLRGSLDLPAENRLADMDLALTLEGSVPPRLAALSPLIDPDDPMQLKLTLRDVDPGLDLDLSLSTAGLALEVDGELSQPANADGVELNISVDADSLPRLMAALDLGETDDLPLEVAGHFSREGRHLRLRDLAITAGEHNVTGYGDVPDFPRSSGASLRLRATGPEFAFYQRLMARPKLLFEPYDIDAEISADPSGGARLRSRTLIGGHVLDVQGPLGDFPVFDDSDLVVGLSGPSLSFIGDQFGVELPARPYELAGRISVSDGVVALDNLKASATAVSVSADGSLRGYPHLDQLQLALSVETPSLADTSTAWALDPLGNVPAAITAQLTGSAAAPVFDTVALSAGRSRVSSTSGRLSLAEGRIASDLVFDVELSGLGELLGSYAQRDLPDRSLRFTLRPVLEDDLLTLELDDIVGDAVRGKARLELSRSLALDERTATEIDLRFASPAEILPLAGALRPPATALRLTAQTSRSSDRRLIRAKLAGESGELNAELAVPLGDPERASLALSGEGPRLREFLTYSGLPPEALPFRVEADVQLGEAQHTLALADLTIAGTTVQGSASYRRDDEFLEAALQVPRAELGRWRDAQPRATSDAAEATESTTVSSDDGRLIPETALPLDWLARRMDLSLSTGPLGLLDRFLDERSLIDSLTARLVSGDGRGELTIEELRGSRGISSGALVLDNTAQPPHVKLQLQARDLPLGMGADDDYLRELPLYRVDLDVEASGADTRELAADLDGTLLVQGGAGTLNNVSLSFATESFLAQLASALIPGIDKSPDMEVECGLLTARASSGIIALDPGFVLRTRKVDMSARGQLDLTRERLKIRFDNQARKGLGVSAASLVNPYVQITGTLARPTLGLDIAGSAIAGGAAAATGGLTVIAKPLLGRLFRRGSPCEAALNRWNEESAEAD